MPRAQPRFEAVDGLRVPLGGVNGYRGVRGKQGRQKNKFQGVTPRKQHRTGPHETPKEAAVALAHLRHDLELGVLPERSEKKPQPPGTRCASDGVRNRAHSGGGRVWVDARGQVCSLRLRSFRASEVSAECRCGCWV